MKMTAAETFSGTGKVRKNGTAVLTLLGQAALVLLMVSGCQLGTGDVALTMDPPEISYTNMMVEFREHFQVTARDIETNAIADGYPVEISMNMADGGCGGPEVAKYWTLEDSRGNPVPCPWYTSTGDSGTVRFALHFSGVGAPYACDEWGYSVVAFGDEGSSAWANGTNECPEE